MTDHDGQSDSDSAGSGSFAGMLEAQIERLGVSDGFDMPPPPPVLEDEALQSETDELAFEQLLDSAVRAASHDDRPWSSGFTARRMAQAQDSREFQPDVVDETKCRALLLNRGYGKVQCCVRPVRGSDLCAKHSRRLLWGRVTGALSQEVLSKFWRTKLKRRPEEQQLYARHLMWQFAVEEVPGIKFLKDLTKD